jgi:hypothetical protein
MKNAVIWGVKSQKKAFFLVYMFHSIDELVDRVSEYS